MRVVVTGATGNVGTSVVRALAADDQVTEIVGIARRPPPWSPPKTRWELLDVAEAPLEPHFAGAAAVVHLAWLIQPSRDLSELERVNVAGSRHVFAAAAAAGAGALVYASSVGAYSPGPKDRAVDESWPTDGIPTSFYSAHKVAVERMVDALEAERPGLRVVRLRPGLIFKREAASGIRRLFVGPLLPSPLVRAQLIATVPSHPRLRVQAVHSFDVAEAYRLVLTDQRARGAYNVAADPVLDPQSLASEFGALQLPLPPALLRVLTLGSWRARLQPTPPGWLDMALNVPIMDTSRIRELGWSPRWTATAALRDLLEGLSRDQGFDTPVLAKATSGPGRAREFLTGIGGRNP